MYRVAICDDEERCVRENRAMTSAILEALGVSYELDCFTSTEELYQCVEKEQGRYQLLLLDIEFDQQSGMELARLLRREKHRTDIIFITFHDIYALEGYDVQAIQYLLKPVRRERLEEAIAYAYARHYKNHPIVFRSGSESHCVRCGDIRYLESFYRRLTIHLEGGKSFALYGTLSDVADKLPAGEFAYCHKSYLVNLAYVEELRRYKVGLSDGTALPVSKGCYDAFRRALLND